MKGIVNYLRGTARVRITGAFPERVINLCAQSRVDFWGVDWRDEGCVCFTVRLAGLSSLYAFARRVNCEVEVTARRGFPVFARGFRRRYGFLTGMALSLCAVGLVSQFILSVEVTGNETVSDRVILQQLQRFGVRPGVFGPGLDRRQIEQEILLELKDLSWMTINLNGTRAHVQVREAQKAPERVDESGFYHIVSRADGMVSRVEAEQGDALVKAGDTVGKGEILISGTVTLEPPKYSDLPNRYYDVHARGRVWARTWRTITAVMPEKTVVKCHTGAQRTCLSINFLGNRVEFFGNSSISGGSCDKITRVRQIVLPGGMVLPVWIARETYRVYETAERSVDRDAAAELMERELRKRLEQLVGADGQILDLDVRTRVSDGLIRVTAVAECLEEIGMEVPAAQMK